MADLQDFSSTDGAADSALGMGMEVSGEGIDNNTKDKGESSVLRNVHIDVYWDRILDHPAKASFAIDVSGSQPVIRVPILSLRGENIKQVHVVSTKYIHPPLLSRSSTSWKEYSSQSSNDKSNFDFSSRNAELEILRSVGASDEAKLKHCWESHLAASQIEDNGLLSATNPGGRELSLASLANGWEEFHRLDAFATSPAPFNSCSETVGSHRPESFHQEQHPLKSGDALQDAGQSTLNAKNGLILPKTPLNQKNDHSPDFVNQLLRFGNATDATSAADLCQYADMAVADCLPLGDISNHDRNDDQRHCLPMASSVELSFPGPPSPAQNEESKPTWHTTSLSTLR